MPPTTAAVERTSGALRLVAHRGDRAVLLAMDLPEAATDRLAGFALFRKPPGRARRPLYNRLDFETPVTAETAAEDRRWHPSDKAPFQKFRWVDIPPDVLPGTYEYTATAMYFDANGALVEGDSVTLPIEIDRRPAPDLQVGFTRGYMSSQAYADKFDNAPFHPVPQTIDFDTKPYRKQYAWLGFHARELVREFLDACVADPAISVDVFAYDLDDPDTIRSFVALGGRLRLILDNADLHQDDGATVASETQAEAAVRQAGGAVFRGRFSRFAHHKVFVAKRNGVPFRALAGSTNFSIRGFYVQANNVLVFDSPEVASWFAEAFDQSWTKAGMDGFRHAPIASGWRELPATGGLPAGAIAFSPHVDGDVSLGRVANAIASADTSILFSVMGLSGTGQVLAGLRAGMAKPDVFSYGVTQSGNAYLSLYKPGSTRAVRVTFAYLKDKVPPPFRAEILGEQGQVIHDKFVVVDFGGADPRVYTGSSNLAKGGEEDNGDHLIELRGPEVAALYSVEAVRQIDHFHFRAAMKTATAVKPLVLKGPDRWREWVAPYYDPADLKSLDRRLFARIPTG